MLLSLSPFRSANNCFNILWCAYVRCKYDNHCSVFLMGCLITIYCSFLHLATFFGLKSIFPDMSMETPAFFWLLFASCIIFHAFTSSLCLSLELRSRGNMYLFFSPSSHSVFWLVSTIHLYLCWLLVDTDSTTIKSIFFFFWLIYVFIVSPCISVAILVWWFSKIFSTGSSHVLCLCLMVILSFVWNISVKIVHFLLIASYLHSSIQVLSFSSSSMFLLS